MMRSLHALRSLSDLIRTTWGFIFYSGPIEPATAARWREIDLARMAHSPEIELAAVGQLLGAGLQHRIYGYREDGEPRVLKVLMPSRWLRFPTVAEAREDLALVRRFMEPFVLEPAGVVPLSDGSYAIQQRRLEEFRAITPPDLQQEDVKRQLLELVRRNAEMMKQVGRSLDFLGREGQRKCRAALVGFHQTPTIANLVVERLSDGSERIWILDTDLENLRPGARNLRDVRSAVAARAAIAINRFLIRHFFQIDIA